MHTGLLIVWGLFWTFFFGVAAQAFHAEFLVINVPIAVGAYCAARRKPLTAYFVVLVLAWFMAVLAGGGRGPSMLAHLIVCLFFVFTRSRLRAHSNLRLAGTVVAGAMLWSLLFALIMGMAGAGGWWGTLVTISPLVAAMTGVFALFNNAVLSQFDGDRRGSFMGEKAPLRPR